MCSKTSSVISLLVSTFGTGILYMPASFKLLGYAYALIAVGFTGMLTYFTLHSLAYCAVATGGEAAATYSSLALAFSSRLKAVIDVTLLLSNLSIAVAALRFFCFHAATLLRSLGVQARLDLLRRLSLCLVIAAAAYLGTKKSLDSLAVVSRISLAGVVYYLCLIFYYAAAHGHGAGQLSATNDNYGSGFVKLVFAMHCQFVFLSVLGQVDDKSREGTKRVCVAASALIACVYALAGMLGYMAVGNEIDARHTLEVFADRRSAFMQSILANTFDKQGVLPALAIALFLFVWFGSLVFVSYPIISIVHSYARRLNKGVGRRSVSCALAVLLFCLGLPSTLSIGRLLDLSGALFTAPISFGYPSLFMILVSGRFSASAVVSYAVIGFTALLAWRIIYATFAAE